MTVCELPSTSLPVPKRMAKGARILEMLRDPEVVKPANPANAHIILDEED